VGYGRVILGTEFCTEGTLPDYFSDKRPKHPIVSAFAYQIYDAIDFCHQHAVFHGDLAGHNIMISTDRGVPVVKIIDFGWSQVLVQPHGISNLLKKYEQRLTWASEGSTDLAKQVRLRISARHDDQKAIVKHCLIFAGRINGSQNHEDPTLVDFLKAYDMS